MAAPVVSWATRRLTCDGFQSSEQLARPGRGSMELSLLLLLLLLKDVTW
jgi:hypothetical protein